MISWPYIDLDTSQAKLSPLGPLQAAPHSVRVTFCRRHFLSASHSVKDSNSCHYQVSHLKYELQTRVSGQVVAPWDDNYEAFRWHNRLKSRINTEWRPHFRKVHTKGCCQKPLLIVRPRSQKVGHGHNNTWSYLQSIRTSHDLNLLLPTLILLQGFQACHC